MSKNSRQEVDWKQQLMLANKLWGPFPNPLRVSLRLLISEYQLSINRGHLLLLNDSWYVTHSALLDIANRRRCAGIRVLPATEFCDAASGRYAFRATVYKHQGCKGFSGYGDANPSNVSGLLHGAEMRVAETRAVNRALRKAYGIGICSVEELGSATPQARQGQTQRKAQKLPPQSSKGSGNSGHGSNGNGTRVRDRLCQLIRQHTLDADLVRAYAVDFCGTKALRDASREQVENFVAHLADWAEKDRNALLCQLNSYIRPAAGAA
jgi:hypothetical protein